MTSNPAPAPAGRPPRTFWRYAQALAAPVAAVDFGGSTSCASRSTTGWAAKTAMTDPPWRNGWTSRAASGRRCRKWWPTTSGRGRSCGGRTPAPDAGPTDLAAAIDVDNKREEISEHLRALGVPPTKMYTGQLPLFPIFYRIEVRFNDPADPPIVWDSEVPYQETQVQDLDHPLPSTPASVHVLYQLHAYNKRQRIEQEHRQRLWQLSILAAAATALVGAWVVVVQRRERQRVLARQQVDRAERELLREARRHEETERKLLEQRLATQAAEQKALELKSQLYASIGIMAGSYAHNIKNLLVRPNDLLRRCLEADSAFAGAAGHVARGPADARHRDGAVAADPADGAPRPQPQRADGPRPERGGARPGADLARPGPRPLQAGRGAGAGRNRRPAVDRRRLFPSATGGGEPAVQRARRHVRDAQPAPRRRPPRRRRWTRRPGGGR